MSSALDVNTAMPTSAVEPSSTIRPRRSPSSPNLGGSKGTRLDRRRGSLLRITLATLGLLGGLAALIVAGLSVAGSGPAPVAEPPAPAMTVTTASVRFEPGFSMRRPFVGQVEPARDSDLGFERAGLVVAVLVDEGDRVERNQEVARLDTRDLESRRAELVAQRAQASAVLAELVKGPRDEVIAAAEAEVNRWTAEHARQQLAARRSQMLFKQQVISDREWDEARLIEESTEAQRIAAQARLAELRNGTRPEQIAAQRAQVVGLDAQIATIDVALDKSILRAPFNGTIAQRQIDEGEVLDAGRAVVTLQETDRFDVRIGVAGDALETLKVGQAHPLTIRETTHQATVWAIRPDRDRRTRTVTVLFRLNQPDPRLRSGDLATLSLNWHVEEQGFWIPVDALVEGVRGLWSCYVATELNDSDNVEPLRPGASHRLTRRSLERIHQSGSEVFVRGELELGDRVVVDGVHRLVPDQDVLVVETGAEAGDVAARSVAPLSMRTSNGGRIDR